MRTQLAIAVGCAALLYSSIADARPRPRAEKFTANKDFGLGLMLGAPTGLNGKAYLTSDTAVDFGIGGYRRFRYHNALQIHADFLWHPATLAKADPFYLALYFGVGARFLFREYKDNDEDDDVHLGVRGPVGLLFDFNRVPIDVFVELALVVDLVVVGNDRLFADLNGLAGVRYYF